MIPILGMHRSGTSALAGALHKLGADLGPESSWIHPAADNPRGFYEYEPVLEIDRAVLAALGGTWSTPPPFPPGWVTDDRIEAQRELARQLAAELPTDMVVKEPRLSLVQPLWDHVSEPRPAVLCLRHPAAVAGSLQSRNEFSVDAGLYLWFRYYAASLINRPDALVVEYERLLADPEPELRRVAAHIGLDPSPTTIAAAAGSVRGGMAHHEGASLPSSPIGEICGALYELLQSGQALADRHDLWIWAKLTTELPWAGPSDRELTIAQGAHRRTLAEVERLQRDNQKLRERAERLERELRHALATVDGVSLAGAASLLSTADGAT